MRFASSISLERAVALVFCDPVIDLAFESVARVSELDWVFDFFELKLDWRLDVSRTSPPGIDAKRGMCVCCVSMRTTDYQNWYQTCLELYSNFIILLENTNYITFHTHYRPSPTSIYNKSVSHPFSSALREIICTNGSNNAYHVRSLYLFVFCLIDQLQWTVDINFTVDCINAALSCSWRVAMTKKKRIS